MPDPTGSPRNGWGMAGHINLAELDAVIKGINLAVSWNFRRFVLAVDSATVVGWLRSVVDRTHNVRTRALSELLIRRRLDLLRRVIEQEKLEITIRQVPSESNRADCLTRVVKGWSLRTAAAAAGVQASDGAVGLSVQQVRVEHEKHHFGVDRTLELAREKFGDAVTRRMVRKVVAHCDQCARIDPAVRNRWKHGQVLVADTWSRLAVDITHVRGAPWLSIVDCGSGFTVWRKLSSETAKEVRSHLGDVFAMFGPPAQLLSDNGTVFRSREVVQLLADWRVEQLLAGAYRPQGNGVVERVHRTIKRMVARTGKIVPECLFWYNSTRGGRRCSPYESVFAAKPRMPGVRAERMESQRPQDRSVPRVAAEDEEHNLFVIGDQVYLRPSNGQCDVQWSGPHRVTAVKSRVLLELDEDGVARHISHVRRVPSNACDESMSEQSSSEDDMDNASASGSDCDGDAEQVREPADPPLRRSERLRRARLVCDSAECP